MTLAIVFGPEAHIPGCAGHCGGIYRCLRCELLCGWCFGAADDMPALCDDCWAALNQEPGK